jgi:hypothetical protein
MILSGNSAVHPSKPYLGRELPPRVLEKLASMPARGHGLNAWFLGAARMLQPYREPAEIESILAAAAAGQPFKTSEITRAVARVEGSADSRRTDIAGTWVSRTRTWPPLNLEQREAIIAGGAELHDLWEASPVRFDRKKSYAEEVIDALFPGNTLLCVGRSNAEFATRPREDWRGRLADMQLIVPSPMTQRFGVTQDGKTSEHSLDNTGPRRFLVVEQDAGTSDEQAAVLLYLAARAPLAAAVHSGSKSIHGWFYAEGRNEDANRRFMEFAVSLGADRATWTRSQFVRMPDGTRESGQRQTVFYFAPEVVQ